MKLQGEVVCAMEATVSGILPSTPCFVLAVLAAQDVNLFIARDAMFKQENPEFMSHHLLVSTAENDEYSIFIVYIYLQSNLPGT